jgi:hypothetical protein
MSSEERMRILRMVEDGRLTADEALELLSAIDESAPEPAAPLEPPAGESPGAEKGKRPRWFCVRVTDIETGKRRVNLKLPVGLISLGLKTGKRFSPELEGLDADEVMAFIQSGEPGHLINVEDNQDGEHVEVFLE